MVKRDFLFLLLLFFCLVVFSALYYFLTYRKKEKLIKTIGACCAAVSCAVFLYLAVFSRSPHETGTELVPFWSYVSGVRYYYALDVFLQVIENIAIFVPIGFLLPFLFGKRANAKSVVGFAFLLSAFAEACQLLFSLGVFETDDLFNNTLGAVVGYGLYCSVTAAKIGGESFVKDEKRFLKGLIPLVSVYELFVFLLVLREILHIF